MSMATAASLSNSIFTPSLPVMQIDLDTSQQAINASVSIATFMNALAPLLWAQLADVRGRRITYILSIPIAILATILGYFSKNIAMFYVTRIFQQIGMSAVLVAGSGTLSDINPSSYRSQALGYFYLGYQGATTIAPALGGVIADSLGWRWTFIVAAVYTVAIFIAMCIFMPETMDPVVLKANRAKGVKNPFAPLVYNKYPFVLALVLQIAFTVMVLYIFSVIIPRDFTRVYAFSTSQIGFVQLFVGFGFFVGTWCFGVYADRTYGTWKAKRGGVSIPEDRLRSTWLPILFIFAGLLVYGWGVERATWFGVPTLGAAVAGAGSQGFGTSCNAFLLDVFPSRGASIIAAANFLRFTLAALGPLAVASAESTIGVGWFSTLLAGVNLAAWSGIFCIIHWGARTRLRMEPWRSEVRWDAQREVLFAAGAGARREKAGEEGSKALLVA
ncbi:MFS general substrate transporter [Gonapodya prolifera JEL478]|uniref:MFS general substrate transporter n=1 Tax=Gonapodya prolifera (strain JEL478) TaxID=1344416 RepID=A0A139A166_GONPJ|nr:MFS general substrate transporter [Gonapodya prolifera JEL478]|eukprot:KXS10511.1 MFS general substrate transporter [Gonapodya prolifera JEL478]